MIPRATLSASLWRRFVAGVRLWRIRRSIARCGQCHRYRGEMGDAALKIFHDVHTTVDGLSSRIGPR